MKRVLLILLLFFGGIFAVVSADIPSYMHVINESKTRFATLGMAGDYGGPLLAVNSTGAIYASFVNSSDGELNYGMDLAYSTDGGSTWTTNVLKDWDLAQYPAQIAIDSNDTVHLIFFAGAGEMWYRNYTLAGGLGERIQMTPTGTTYEAAMAIGPDETIHLVYDLDFTGAYAVGYVNISPVTGVGTHRNISYGINPWYPLVSVGNDNTVHIVYGEDSIPGGVNPEINFEYVNLSSSGWSPIIRMMDEPYNAYPAKLIVDSNDKLHIAFLEDIVAGLFYYTNASGDSNFLISEPINVSATQRPVIQQLGQTMSIDKAGTIHFIYDTVYTPDMTRQMFYRNFTSSGFGTEYRLDPSRVNAVWPPLRYARALDSGYPSNNRLETGTAFVFSNVSGIAYANGNTVEFGYFPEANWTLPIVGFTQSATSGIDALTVSFTETSTGEVYYSWKATDIGSGSVNTFSSDQNPSYTFASGNWTIQLTVTDFSSASNTSALYGAWVNVSTTPYASPWKNSSTSIAYIAGVIEMGLIVVMLAAIATIIIMYIRR